MKKVFIATIVVTLAVALMLSFSLATAVSATAQSTYHVAATGDDGNDGSQDHPWLTIQHAVDTIQPGDTIIVASGIYVEHIVISVSNINLIGEDRETTIIDAHQASSSLVAYNGIFIYGANDANGITISGFTIKNVDLDENGYRHPDDNTYGASGLGKVGIQICSSDNNCIEGNFFIDNRKTISIKAGGGVGCSNNKVINNIFAESNASAINLHSHGADSPVTNTEIKNNQYQGDNRNGVDFSGDKVSSNFENTTIIGNDFNGCYRGVAIKWHVGEADFAGMLVNFNNFVGCDPWGFINDADVEIDATKNWWGSPTGPRRQLPNDKWVGKGCKVSGNVDFTPWLPLPIEFWL